jgi:hypothetical protein
MGRIRKTLTKMLSEDVTYRSSVNPTLDGKIAISLSLSLASLVVRQLIST